MPILLLEFACPFKFSRIEITAARSIPIEIYADSQLGGPWCLFLVEVCGQVLGKKHPELSDLRGMTVWFFQAAGVAGVHRLDMQPIAQRSGCAVLSVGIARFICLLPNSESRKLTVAPDFTLLKV